MPKLKNKTKVKSSSGGSLFSSSSLTKVFNNYKDLKTKILSASIRNLDHVKEVAKAGSDIATIPPKVFHEMYKHELTDKGLKVFLDDWNSTNQKIS